MIMSQFEQQEILFKRLKGEMEDFRSEKQSLSGQIEQHKNTNQMLRKAEED